MNQPTGEVCFISDGRLQPEHRAVFEEHVHLLRHAVGQRIGVIDVHLQQRAGNVELLARQGALVAVGAHLGEIVLHGQTEGSSAMPVELPMVTMRAAEFDELLELRHGLVFGDASGPAAVLLGNGSRGRASAASTAATASAETAAAANGAADEDQHVELALQVAGVERRRDRPLERHLILLEQPPRPAGRHACRRTDRRGRCGSASASGHRPRAPCASA